MTDDASPVARRDRPVTEESYGIPSDDDGLLPRAFVAERLAADRRFWITTLRPDGSPHVRPTWGVWVDGRFHWGGGERTRWMRNLERDDRIVVHREDAAEVVLLEGRADPIDDETGDAALVERLDAAYEEKYDVRHGTPFVAVSPTVAYAWSTFPTDATRWTFPEREE